MDEKIITSIQFKRGEKEALEAKLVGDKNPLRGEPIWELDTNKIKIGDGINDYVNLPYIAGGGSGSDQLFFGSRYEFPNVGQANILYIAKDELNTYIWENNKYKLLHVDGREIDGGGADVIY